MDKNIKHEWRKKEKDFYLPKDKPELVDIPEFKFFTIKGQGNPNSSFFCNYIEALYSLSYTLKMLPKKGIIPEGYFDYTVYPLEGVWDLTEEAKQNFNGTIDKNQLVFNLMIRQPDFLSGELAFEVIEIVKKKNSDGLLNKVRFEEIKEGKCVQMLHLGSYDNEPMSFQIIDEFCGMSGLKRISKTHREIYLSDARKVEPEKLKTILRIRVV